MKKYYAGLDVSLEETAVCITDQSGEIVKEGMVPTDPNSIMSYLQASGFPLERVGLEASNLSIWLYHELFAAGHPVTVIETRHAKAALKAQQVKTDRNDARGLPTSCGPAGTKQFMSKAMQASASRCSWSTAGA